MEIKEIREFQERAMRELPDITEKNKIVYGL